MKQNVGGTERAIRAVVGLVILGVGFYYKSPWGLIGLIPLFTAAVGFCPAYVPFGINTCCGHQKAASKTDCSKSDCCSVDSHKS